MDVAGVLSLIVVTYLQVSLEALGLFISIGEVEGEEVVLEQVLTHHLVEDWSHSLLSEGWVSQTNDGLEVGASEDGPLLKHLTKLLVLDVDLAR